MNEKRRWPRSAPPLSEQLLTVHGLRKHVIGKAVDQSLGGLGIRVALPAKFEIGEPVLIQSAHPNRLRMATIRHVVGDGANGQRLGIEWHMN
jgi:hypothetical protein